MCRIDDIIKNSFEFKIIQKLSNLKIPSKEVPKEIRDWVKDWLHTDLREYTLKQGEEVVARDPWHDADSNTYKMFKLMPDGSAQATDFEFTKSGPESNPWSEGTGKTKVPSGHVIVMIGIYPKRAVIYTAEDAQMFLPKTDIQLTDDELKALYYARAYISSARPKFSDEVYNSLIEKKLLRKNKSITLEGKNTLENTEIKEKLKKIGL